MSLLNIHESLHFASQSCVLRDERASFNAPYAGQERKHTGLFPDNCYSIIRLRWQKKTGGKNPSEANLSLFSKAIFKNSLLHTSE